ncbi:MAG: glyoxal oxidase N-terminus-domain-containing protein [Podila humilis]|nr:MAG: glyoxal oxidase N-terminus-domain-containing protein [Podila humilis]
MVFIRKLGFALAATIIAASWSADAAACKYNNGLACPQETPCCSLHGHCGNSPLACSTGCDASASFNGVCERYTPATLAGGKPKPVPSLPKGSFKVVGDTGVAAQHIALVSPTKMLILDKAENNPAKLPDGTAAYNVEYDLTTNTFRVLEVQTNTFCSGGGFLPNGTLISGGGAESRLTHNFRTGTGFQSLRMWEPCEDASCHWIENPQDPMWQMTGNRWKQRVAGNQPRSHQQPTFELYPKPEGYQPVPLQFMIDAMPYNLYPNVYSLPDGNIYIFANQKSMIYNVQRQEVIKNLPDIPGGARSYPLTGSHVLLPLDPAKNYAHEVLVCGGSEAWSTRAKAIQSCGRINLNDADPQWEMDQMPTPRLMSDAVILADGKVMLLNGAQVGYAGFLRASNPIYTPVVYDPNAPLGQRWTEWVPSNIARMYHSVAMLLPDGTVFVAGSNQNSEVRFENVPFPTEYRVESFTPPYLTTDLPRPEIVSQIPAQLQYDQQFEVTIDIKDGERYEPEITFMFGHRGFVTHSTHMSQRMTKLVANKVSEEGTKITYNVFSPPTANLMPPGPHYIHVLNNGVPSHAEHLILN